VKIRPLLIVLIICLLGITISTLVYAKQQKNAAAIFADELSVNALNRLTERGETFLVYFYGRSCEDCVASEPYLREAVRQLHEADLWPQDLPIYKCEREANATVRSLYGVEHTPTVLYFSTGAESARLEGPYYDVAAYSTFFAGLQ